MELIYGLVDAGIFLTIPYVLVRVLKGLHHWFTKHDPVVCLHCGHEGPARIVSKGHWAVEAGLWLVLIIPGLIYSIWRFSTQRQACGSCAHARLAKPQSPAARAKLSDLRSVVHGANPMTLNM